MNYNDTKIGMKVDYHAVIGGPVTKRNCTIESDPWQISHGEWVILLIELPKAVSLNAISETEPIRNKEEVYDQDIKPLMSQLIDICIENKIPMVAEYHIPIDSHPGLCVSTAVVEHIEYVPEHILAILCVQQMNRLGLYKHTDE